MRATNAEYDEIMKRRVREPINARIEVRNGIKTPDSVSVNRTPVTTVTGTSYQYGKLGGSFDYARLEKNHIMLDADQYFWPVIESNGAKRPSRMEVVPGDTVPGMTLTLRSAGGSRVGLTIWFDIYLGEWPTSFDVSYPGKNGVVSKRIYPKGPKIYIPFDDYVSMTEHNVFGEVKLYNFVNSGRGAPAENHSLRISMLVLGGYEVFDSLNIIQCDKIDDVDPISRRMPRQHFKFSILDLENLYSFGYPGSIWPILSDNSVAIVKYIMPGQEKDKPIAEIFGGSYPLDKYPVHSGILTSFNCKSVLETTVGSKYESEPKPWDPPHVQTLMDKVNELGRYSGQFDIPDDVAGERNISESLNQIQTYPRLPYKSYSECLQIVANAGCCSVYTINGRLQIKDLDISIPSKQAFHLAYNQILKNGIRLKHSPKLKSIEVCINNDLLSRKQTDTRYMETAPIYSEVITIEKGSYRSLKIATDSPAQGELTDSYRNVAYIRIPQSQWGRKVYINGTETFRETKETISEKFSYNADEIAEKVDNPLIVSSESAKRVMETLKKYYALTDTYTIKYRGNPELEPGDRIWVGISETEEIPVLILKTQINYKGSITGEIVAKRLKGV